MGTIRKLLGITELIKLQGETNILLKDIINNQKDIIKLQKHSIDNECEVFSNKRKAR